jgi:hypothetical protein
MAFHLIQGTFHVAGYSPDGDSIRFKAKDTGNWSLLGGHPAKLNSKGHVQLRLEAIDTLETHFQNTHQPLELARAAMNHLMAQLGIENVVWNTAQAKVESAKDGTPGYVIAREVEKNGRPVAFAFAGDSGQGDGVRVFFDADLALNSVNAEMLGSGLAYPTFYKGLFSDLRQALALEAAKARAMRLGIWARDATNTGFVADSLSAIAEDYVILPKLFRRLAVYLEGGGAASGFKGYLEQLAEEVLVISTAHITHFDTLVEERGNRLRLVEPPENLVFAG